MNDDNKTTFHEYQSLASTRHSALIKQKTHHEVHDGFCTIDLYLNLLRKNLYKWEYQFHEERKKIIQVHTLDSINPYSILHGSSYQIEETSPLRFT